uniref:C-type lectin domain-containing protein n=1 Tax=Accipiter nisus TaxID=211598 RepID=A0A8B9MKH9_9AVES
MLMTSQAFEEGSKKSGDVISKTSATQGTELRMWLGIAVLISLAVCLAVEEATIDEGTPCSKYQLAFNHSCYEFVRLRHTFTSAQSWCSDSVIVLLRKINIQDNITLFTGSMIWLDTSNISYSNWYKDQPSPFSSTCGYILKNAKYRWGVTENCSQEFDFICEFGKIHNSWN